MNRYSEYKPINLPWLANIPSHWDIRRNKNVFTELKEEVGEKSSAYTLLSLTLSGIIPRDMDGGGKFPASFDKYKIVKNGNMAFCLFDVDETPRTVGLSNYDGMLTGAYTIMDVHDINARYAYYYYLSLDNCKALKPLYTGLRKTININTFQSTKLPIPPRTEQDQIVRFLDWKVSGINRLINLKRKTIQSLKDCRKALVDQAILYGFHSEKTKENEVYWLKDTPESWAILPLKRLCQINASVSDIAKSMDGDAKVTFLPMENVSVKGEVDCSIKRKLDDVRTGYSSFARGDIVVPKITPCFENGKGACLDRLDTEIGYGTTEFINLRPNEKVLSKYLYLITMTRPFRILGEEVMTGSAGQKRVPVDYIKNFTLAVPSVDRQKDIIAELDTKLKKIDELVKVEEEKIYTLDEFKNCLIADAVTGKIDVRDIEIPEYEFTDESANVDSEDADFDVDEEQEE